MAVVINGTSGITGNSGTVISASTIGVGGATPSASGAGITFPATQSASTDANTLDDYEEGTWTPTITFGGNQTGQTYAIQVGRYTKVGNLVTVIGNAQLLSSGSATGALAMSNLPFSSANINDYIITCATLIDNASSAIDQPVGSLSPNSNSVSIVAGTGANNANGLTEAVRGASFRVRIAISYQIS
jgi:hypothetical protein